MTMMDQYLQVIDLIPKKEPTLVVRFSNEAFLAEFTEMVDSFQQYGVTVRTSIVTDPEIIFPKVGRGRPLQIEENRLIGLKAVWSGSLNAERIWICPELIDGRYFRLNGVDSFPAFTSFDRHFFSVKSSLAIRAKKCPVRVRRTMRQLKNFASEGEKINLFQCLVTLFNMKPDIGYYMLNNIQIKTPGLSNYAALGEMCEFMGLDIDRIKILTLKEVRDLGDRYVALLLKKTNLNAPAIVFPREWFESFKDNVSASIVYFLFKHATASLRTILSLEDINRADCSLIQFLSSKNTSASSEYSSSIIASLSRLFLKDRYRIMKDLPELTDDMWDSPSRILYWLASTPNLRRRFGDQTSCNNRRFIWLENLLRPVAEAIAEAEFQLQNTGSFQSTESILTGKNGGIDRWSIIGNIRSTEDSMVGTASSALTYDEFLKYNFGSVRGQLSAARVGLSPDNVKVLDGFAATSKTMPGRSGQLTPHARFIGSPADGLLAEAEDAY